MEEIETQLNTLGIEYHISIVFNPWFHIDVQVDRSEVQRVLNFVAEKFEGQAITVSRTRPPPILYIQTLSIETHPWWKFWKREKEYLHEETYIKKT